MELIALRETINEDYSRYMPIREFDETALRRAKEIFKDYKKRGVIISGRFDDTSWTLTNEARNVGLTLLTFEGGLKKTAMSWIGCAYRQYVSCVKAYIILNLGEIGLSTLQKLTRQFNRLAVSTSDDTADMLEYAAHIVALLRLIPGGNEQRDSVIEELEEKIERRSRESHEKNRRKLADFKSYLGFHEVMANFWLGADERQKLFYFPLYFWWNLTAILPLRPTEFLLTPMNCLRICDGEHLLTVRRTKLKGGQEKISYRIAGDYELREYTISEALAAELRWYMELTAAEQRTQIDTLLAQGPHYMYFSMSPISTSRYYTYHCLCTCLRYFYDEVINPGGYDIARICLGDTRHLAMTNLILSGGSPVICRELAGHANIEASAHYYANVSNLVECATIIRYRKSMSGDAVIHGASKYPVTVPPNISRINGGRCASGLFKGGSVDDCLKVVGDGGHIGDCRFCGHYLPDNPGFTIWVHDEKTAKKQLDEDSRYLIRMIELVRKGIGLTEDIGAALHRLQHSGSRYSKCLWENLSGGEKNNGKTKEVRDGRNDSDCGIIL